MLVVIFAPIENIFELKELYGETDNYLKKYIHLLKSQFLNFVIMLWLMIHGAFFPLRGCHCGCQVNTLFAVNRTLAAIRNKPFTKYCQLLQTMISWPKST